MDRPPQASQAVEAGGIVIVLAIVSGVAIIALAAIVLVLIWAGRSTVRDVTPQLRMAPPAKHAAPKDDEAYLPGPPFAGGTGSTS